MKPGVGHALLAVASVAIVATVIAAIAVMGSPTAQRETRMDERRLSDLRRIARTIDQHVQQHGTLPPDLATLARQLGVRLPLADPATSVPYGYRTEDGLRYQLCAVFSTDSGQTDGWVDAEWPHGQGERCFPRKADKGR